jgi:hypothetical protein
VLRVEGASRVAPNAGEWAQALDIQFGKLRMNDVQAPAGGGGVSGIFGSAVVVGGYGQGPQLAMTVSRSLTDTWPSPLISPRQAVGHGEPSQVVPAPSQ